MMERREDGQDASTDRRAAVAGGMSGRLDLIPARAVRAEEERYARSIVAPEAEDKWPRLDGLVGIFFASRSGSTALTRHIERLFDVSGVGESLNGPALRTRMERHHRESFSAEMRRYIAAHGTSGWFVFKAGGRGVINGERMGMLDAYQGILRPVMLLRRDIVAQALSYVTAAKSRQYHSSQTAARELSAEDYDHAAMLRAINTIDKTCRFLDSYASAFPGPRYALSYESFRDGDSSRISHLFSSLGLPKKAVEDATHARQVERLERPVTAIWRQRFDAEADEGITDRVQEYQSFVDSCLGESPSL